MQKKSKIFKSIFPCFSQSFKIFPTFLTKWSQKCVNRDISQNLTNPCKFLVKMFPRLPKRSPIRIARIALRTALHTALHCGTNYVEILNKVTNKPSFHPWALGPNWENLNCQKFCLSDLLSELFRLKLDIFVQMWNPNKVKLLPGVLCAGEAQRSPRLGGEEKLH